MFDELKIRSLLKKEINKDKYKSLSPKIKSDPRIIDHLIKCDKEAISLISSQIDITNYILQDYSLVQYLDSKQLNKYINKIVIE